MTDILLSLFAVLSGALLFKAALFTLPESVERERWKQILRWMKL